MRSRTRNRFVAVAGLLLSVCLPVAGQAARARIVLASASAAPRALPATITRASRASSPSVLPERPIPHPKSDLAPAYKSSPSLASRLPIDNFRSPLLTESSVPLVHLWRGLKLDAFETTVYSYSLDRGAPESGVAFESLRPLSKDQASLADSFGGSGISLRYTLGNSAASKPVQIWRCVSLIARQGGSCAP